MSLGLKVKAIWRNCSPKCPTKGWDSHHPCTTALFAWSPHHHCHHSISDLIPQMPSLFHALACPQIPRPRVPLTPFHTRTSADGTALLHHQMTAAGKSEAPALDLCTEGSPARKNVTEEQPHCFEKVSSTSHLPSPKTVPREPEDGDAGRLSGGVRTKEFGSHWYKGNF